MPRILLPLLLLLSSMSAAAQRIDSLLLGHSVHYVSHHLLLQKGENFNVVDTEIEWPEVIDLTQMTPLHETVCKLLWNQATANIDSLYTVFLTEKGQPVESELPTLPDDQRFCYFKTTITIRDYAPRRWITLSIQMDVEPQPLSPYPAKKVSRIITYDLNKEKVLMAGSILNLEALYDADYSGDILDRLLAPLSDNDYNNTKSIQITDIWPEDNGTFLGFHMVCQQAEKVVSYDRSLPTETLRAYLTPAARKMIEKDPAPKKKKHFFPMPLVWLDDSVYNKVDKMPQPQGGSQQITEFMAHNITPDSKAMGRLLLSYLVDKEGHARDIRVVSPVSPAIDRSAARALRMLPAYMPGEHGGKPVQIRMTLPIQIVN